MTGATSMQNAERGERSRRRLRNLLLDRRFQLKYTGMIVALASLISAMLGVFLISTVRENSRMLKLDDPLDQMLQARLADADAHTVGVLVVGFLVFVLVLGFLSIVLTHRMAGPVFVAERHIREIAQGRLPPIRKLRRGDEFVGLIEALSEAIGVLADRSRAEIVVLERMRAALTGEAHRELLADITTMIEDKQRMLSALDQK